MERPRRIATDVLGDVFQNTRPIVGAGPGGRVVVAYQDTRGIYVVTRAPSGSFGPGMLVRAATEDESAPEVRAVVVDESGGALLVLDTEWSFAPPSATGLDWSAPAPLPEPGTVARVEHAPGAAVLTTTHEGGT